MAYKVRSRQVHSFSAYYNIRHRVGSTSSISLRLNTMSVLAQSEEPLPDRRGHLVYTGKLKNGTTTINIHTWGSNTATHWCNATFPNDTSPTDPIPSHMMLKEHGWFQDIDLFVSICRTQPVPNLPPDEALGQWGCAILTTLATTHSALWIPGPAFDKKL